MPVKALQVRVSTPTAPVAHGRGFYQLEEEELYIPVEYPLERTRFFSFLESRAVTLLLDRQGRLIFIEISIPRRRWKVKEELVVPELASAADTRFLNFRESFVEPSIFCDRVRQNVMIRFTEGKSAYNYYLANNVIVQVSSHNTLVAIWISDIVDDFAGQELATWRKAARGERAARPLHAARLQRM